MTDIRIPSNANFDRINEILVALYRAKASETPAKLADVASRVGIDETTVSRQNAFLLDAGFLRKEASGFHLTELGARYAKFIDFGQVEEAKKLLRQIFREWESIQPLLDYIDINSPLSKKDLRGRIAIAADRKDAGGNRAGIGAVLSMLEFTDLIAGTEEGFVLNREVLRRPDLGMPEGEGIEAGVPEIEIRKPGPSVAELPAPPRLPTQLRIEISLNVNEDSSPKKIKELLRAIREVLSEEEGE